MKVVLVTNKLGYTDNIAIGYLSIIAKNLGHKTFYCSLDRDNLSEKVIQIRPDVIGYTATSFDIENIIVEHNKAKQCYDYVSIVGGAFPTSSPESIKKYDFDAYCIGEGEGAWADFLQCLERKKPFDNIKNIVTKKKTNDVRSLISNLDDLPMPDRDIVFSNSFHKDSPKKTFFSSRGCYFNCNYCCNNLYQKLYKGKGTIVRKFSVDCLLKQIKDIRSRYRMDFIKFSDDCFCINDTSWLREFANKYKQEIGIPFNCFLRIDYIDDEMLSLLKHAGCHSVHLSVDSLSHHVRKNVLNRRMKDIDLVRMLRKIRKYDIETWVNFMVAIPESTIFDDLNTIMFCKFAKISYPSYTTLVPMNKTKLYDYCIENNITIDDDADFFRGSGLSCFGGFSKMVRQNINRLGAVINNIPMPFTVLAVPLLFLPFGDNLDNLWGLVHKYYVENKIYILNKKM